LVDQNLKDQKWYLTLQFINDLLGEEKTKAERLVIEWSKSPKIVSQIEREGIIKRSRIVKRKIPSVPTILRRNKKKTHLRIKRLISHLLKNDKKSIYSITSGT